MFCISLSLEKTPHYVFSHLPALLNIAKVEVGAADWPVGGWHKETRGEDGDWEQVRGREREEA